MSILKLKKLNPNDTFFIELLKSIVQKISSFDSNCQILVFGSFLSDHFNQESDIDIAVLILDTVSPKKFLDDLYKKGPLSKWPLDLLVFKKSDYLKKSDVGGVCFDIKETGVELYPHWNLNTTKTES